VKGIAMDEKDERGERLLPNDWYLFVPAADIDKPGLYRWDIEGVGSYIGKYTKPSRPKKHYARNVRRLLANEPYRKNKPEGFRVIHRVLAKAFCQGRRITLTIVKNYPVEELHDRERAMINELQAAGIKLLNDLPIRGNGVFDCSP